MSHSEKTCEERFAEDLDLLLANQAAVKAEDDDYQANVALARSLSQVHFAPSRVFESRLQSQLQNQLYKLEVRTMSPLSVLRSLARPLLVASLSAAILFAAWLVVSPDARAAVQGWVGHFAEVDSPWALLPSAKQPQSQASEVAPGTAKLAPETQPTSNPLSSAKPSTSLETPPKPGSEATSGTTQPPIPNTQPTRNLISLEAAQAQVDFKIRVPSKLPNGYKFMGIAPKPELSATLPDVGLQAPANLPAQKPPQAAILVFANSAGDVMMLSEMHVSDPAALDMPFPVGKGSVQDVTINGQAAQYIEGIWTPTGWDSNGNHQLHWQTAENIMFDLVSRTLGLSDLMPVAESIK
jgi:hypothetical protein